MNWFNKLDILGLWNSGSPEPVSDTNKVPVEDADVAQAVADLQAAFEAEDFATETTLEAMRVLLAAIHDGSATIKVDDDETQAAIASLEGVVSGTDFSTETTLAQVLTALQGSIEVTQGTSPWVVSGSVTTTPSGTQDVSIVGNPAGLATEATLASILAAILPNNHDVNVTNEVEVTLNGEPVALDADTLAALETITVNQGTSPWVVSGTVTSTPSGTQDVSIVSAIELEVTLNGEAVALDAAALAVIADVTAAVEAFNSDFDSRDLATETTLEAIRVIMASIQSTHFQENQAVSQGASGSDPWRMYAEGYASSIGVNSEDSISGGLWSGNVWTGAGEQNNLAHVGVDLRTDESGTLYFETQINGGGWFRFPVDGFSVTADINEIHTGVKLGRDFRAVFEGTDGSRTRFDLHTFYSSVPIELSSPLNKSMPPDSDGKIVKSAHQVQFQARVSDVPDGWYDTPTLTRLREVRTRDQRALDIANCNDFTEYTILGDDTGNLADSLDHVFGGGALVFDKLNGAGNTVFAGVSHVIADPYNIGEAFEDGGFVACGVKIPSIANVDYVFVRLGTDASNYNEWRWSVDNLTAGEWLQLRRATSQPSAFLGNGWNDNSVAWCAFGVAFNSQSNTLAGIRFDNVHVVQGRISDTTIVATVDSNISGNKVDVTKIGGTAVDKNTGNASPGTQRVVLASDQPTVPVLDAAAVAALENRYGGGKEPATITLTTTSEVPIITPAAGNAIRVFWVSAINSAPATSFPVANIRIGTKSIYNLSAISHWEIFEGAADEEVTGQLSVAGQVDVTIHYQEFTP